MTATRFSRVFAVAIAFACQPVEPGTLTLTVDDPNGLGELAGSQALLVHAATAATDYAVFDRIPDPESTTWTPVLGPSGELRVIRNVYLVEDVELEATWVALRNDWWRYFVDPAMTAHIDLLAEGEVLGIARTGPFTLHRGAHETRTATTEPATRWSALTDLAPDGKNPSSGRGGPGIVGIWQDGPQPSWLDVQLAAD